VNGNFYPQGNDSAYSLSNLREQLESTDLASPLWAELVEALVRAEQR
jgi:hypothetical protein